VAVKSGQPAIKYSIITAFSAKGINAAEKGLARLRKSFGKTTLAQKLTFAAIGAGVVALAKKAADAARQQDKLNKQLSFTLNNLGYKTAIPSVNRFIDELERQAAVADDVLIPSFNALVRVTKQLTDAQDALKLALDISAITGDDVAVVADALAKGFAGNLTAINKLVPGLDQAAIKAKDMQAIMRQLNAEFGGAAINNLDSFAGKMEVFKISISKALENIGEGLLDFLKGFTKTNSIQELGDAIENIGLKIGDILRGLPVLLKTFFTQLENDMKQSFIGRFFLSAIKKIGDAFTTAADKASETGRNMRLMRGIGWGRLFDIAPAKKWAGTVDPVVKKITELQKRSKLQELFDPQRNQIAAALTRNLTAEQRALVQGLEALRNENVDDDEAYYNKIIGLSAKSALAQIDDQKKVQENLKTTLAGQLADYEKYLTDAREKAKYASASVGGTTITGPRGLLENLGVPSSGLQSPVIGGITPPPPPSSSFGAIEDPATQVRNQAASNPAAPPVTVNVNAGVVGDQDFLVRTINNYVTMATRNGYTTVPAGFWS
jgi:hypothetical protein